MANSDDRLKLELKVYSARYEKELRNKGISEEQIKISVDKWVENSYSFYKKSGMDIDSVTASFAFLNSAEEEPQTEFVDDQISSTVKK